MDRLEFLSCIKCECDAALTDIMSSFFDQYMLLYDLLDTANDVSVLSTFERGIIFKVSYNDTLAVQNLANKLSMIPYATIYEKQYSVSFSVDNNSITINISCIM